VSPGLAGPSVDNEFSFGHNREGCAALTDLAKVCGKGVCHSLETRSGPTVDLDTTHRT
jgi:hypothetical protein